MSELQRILIVEDDPFTQALLRVTLEEVGGFVVEACEDGRAALARVDDFAPDLILLDVMMPGMDGPETLRHLRAREATARTPVIFLTARTREEDLEHFRALGVQDIINKPVNPATLSHTVQNIWTYYHG